MTSPNEHSPQKEYIITEEDILILEDTFGVTLIMPRSRPHTPIPALPIQTCNICNLARGCEINFGVNGYPPCVTRATTHIRNATLKEQRKNIVFEINIDKFKRDEYIREVAYQISKYIGTNTKIIFQSPKEQP